MKRPMMKLPSDGAPDRAEATERDGREHEQQDLEADLVVEALGHAQQDARQAGQRRTADPDQRDDPVDVDAGRGGQGGVVGDRAGRLADPGVLQRRSVTHDDARRWRRTMTTSSFGVMQQRADVPGSHGGVLRVVVVVGAGEVLVEAAQEDRRARCSRSSSRSGPCHAAAVAARGPRRGASRRPRR